MVLGDLLKEAIRHLKDNKVEDPSYEAGLLLSHVLGRDPGYVYAHPEEEVSNETAGQYRSLVERRGRHEPFAYITGECGFLDMTLFVNRHVLIPREETELLAQSALWALGKTPRYFNRRIPRLPEKGAYRVLDVGTGSGCIAVSLARHCDYIHVDAVDISVEAIAVARKNAEKYGVESRIDFIVSDFLNDFAIKEKYDLIVSNPPYIPEKDIKTLPVSVKGYEPLTALAAGSDGLIFYRALAERARSLLFGQGMIIVECGFNQGREVKGIFSETGMETFILKDLAGIDRIVAAVSIGDGGFCSK